jgi:hypothetical protein
MPSAKEIKNAKSAKGKKEEGRGVATQILFLSLFCWYNNGHLKLFGGLLWKPLNLALLHIMAL